MTKVAIYARVSTKEGKQSYDRQVSDLKKLAIRDGHKEKDIDVYAEMESGFVKDRPELNKLLKIIEENNRYYKLIYCSELSRLGRSPSDTRRIIDDLTDKKVPVYFHNLNQTTIDKDGKRNMMLNIVLQVSMEFSMMETEQIKTRTHSGRSQSVRKGKWGMGGVSYPYGYIKNKEGFLVKNEEEIKIVHRIFDLYLNGKGLHAIASILNTENIPTRSNKTNPDKTIRHKIERKGSQVKWTANTIHHMLKNTMYYGVRQFQGEEVPLPHLSIITKEQFEEIQHLLKNKKTKNYRTKYIHLLRQKIVCGVCGRKYSPRFAYSNNLYKCLSTFLNTPCGNHTINIPLTDSIILDGIVDNKNLILSSLVLDDMSERLTSEIEDYVGQIKVLEKEIKDVTQQKERLVDGYMEGFILKKQMTERTKSLDIKLSNLEGRIEVMKGHINAKKKSIKDLIKKEKSTELNLRDREKLSKMFDAAIHKMVINTVDGDYALGRVQPFEGVDTYIMVYYKRGQQRNTKGVKTYKYKITLTYPDHPHFPIYDGDILVDCSKLLKYFEKVEERIVPPEHFLSLEDY